MKSERAEERLAELRRRAEEQAEEPPRPRDLEEALAIAQELAVHQIELQLQNQELLIAQEDLAEAHDLYLKLFDLAPVGYLRLDLGGRILEANQAAVELLGRSSEWLQGRAFFSYARDQDLAALQKHYAEASGNKEPSSCEATLTVGAVVILRTVALSRVDHSRGFLTAMVDVSDRRRQEREIRISRERYKRLYQDLPMPSLTWELRGEEMILAEVNQAELKVTKGLIKEYIGRPMSDLHGDRPQVLADAHRAFASGEVVTREHPMCLKTTGQKLFVRHSWTPVGRDRLLEHIEDITEEHSLQDQLERHRQELEVMVSERTVELEAKSVSLQEANTALKVLLESRVQEMEELEESVTSNLVRLVLPLLHRLAEAPSPAVSKSLAKAAERHLSEITAGFARKLTSQDYGLSPRELEIAGLIKTGKTSDEIADILCISPTTVNFHRGNIRDKLGLRAEKVRLATYLQNISQK